MITDPHRETEVKIRIASLAEIRQKIGSCGFDVLMPRHFERNMVFDYHDESLRKKRTLLRLRESAGKTILTLKTPVQETDSSYKIRHETELEIPSGELIKRIFLGIGLEVFFIYEKYREVYSKDNIMLMVDETPIGNFLEIEGTPESIDHVSQLLGFSKDSYIVHTYFQLFRLSNPSGHMEFIK